MENTNYQYISFDGGVDDGKSMIISSQMFNGMLRCDKNSGEVIYVDSFQNENPYQQGLHHKVYLYDKYYVFAPDNAKSIYVYDIEQKNMQCYNLYPKDEMRCRCIDSYLYQNKLWLFFAYYEKPIVVLDLQDFTITYLDIIEEKLPIAIKERNVPTFWTQLEKKDNMVYGGIWASSYVMKLNISTQEVQIVKIDEQERKLCNIAYDGIDFWFTQLGSRGVYRWNEEKGNVVEFTPVNSREESSFVYNNIVCIQNEVLIIPNEGTEILCVNKEKKIVEMFCRLPDNFEKMEDARKTWRRFFSYDVVDDVLRLYPTNANMMVDIYVTNKKSEGLSVVIDINNDKIYQKKVVFEYIENLHQQGVISQTKEIALNEYLKYLTDKNK